MLLLLTFVKYLLVITPPPKKYRFMSLKKQLKDFGLSQVAPPRTRLFPLMLLERTGAVLGMGGHFSPIGSSIHELFVGGDTATIDSFFNAPSRLADMEISRVNKVSLETSADIKSLLKVADDVALEAAVHAALQREGELVFVAAGVEQHQANLEAIGKFMNSHELDKTSPNYNKLRDSDLYMVMATINASEFKYGKTVSNMQSVSMNVSSATATIDHSGTKKTEFVHHDAADKIAFGIKVVKVERKDDHFSFDHGTPKVSLRSIGAVIEEEDSDDIFTID